MEIDYYTAGDGDALGNLLLIIIGSRIDNHSAEQFSFRFLFY